MTVILKAAPVGLALLIVQADARPLDLIPYVNARYGFTLLIPKSFRADPPPVNGDGRSFVSPDTTVTVSGSGHVLDPKGDMAAEFTQELGFEKQDGLTLTYSRSTKTGFTYSGLDKGRIVYVRAIPSCGGDAVVSLTVTYPVSAKAALERSVIAMAKSLHATKGCL